MPSRHRTRLYLALVLLVLAWTAIAAADIPPEEPESSGDGCSVTAPGI